jgi:hypothetical protein
MGNHFHLVVEAELAARRKSDPGKLAIADRLRKDTTLSIKEIAIRVGLGTANSANSNLYRWSRSHSQPPENHLKTGP